MPAVAVCVSTYDRPALLERLLAALAGQATDEPFEVCVCDNGSGAETGAVLDRWSDRLALTAVRLDRNAGPAGGRNAAWRLATAPVVAFTDDDCLPAADWLAAHLAAHRAHEGPAVVVGRVEPTPADEPLLAGRFPRSVRVGSATYFETCNTSYPRDLLAAAGGFDESFRTPAGEDTDLGLRCVERGAAAVFAPAALVHHGVRPSSLRATLRETVRWADIPLVVRKHPATRRTLLAGRWFWKPSHPPALLAAAGLLLGTRRPAALLLVLPWLRFRRHAWPVRRTALPGQLLVDLAEVATMARGSVRHRTFLL